VLYNRGIQGEAAIEAFLSIDGRLDSDPFALPDMELAVNRVYRALISGETIAVYGDFDADGITATALLVEGLSALGATVVPYIPHRVNEGYGLRFNTLERLFRQGVSLVVTCDCGISAATEIRQAQKAGLDIIVTDHHVPPPDLPRAHAVVNPKRLDSSYGFRDLAGVGVAYKFIQALLTGSGKRALAEDLLDLVALGTVADMCPLVGENRYLVTRGIQVLNRTERPGLQELVKSAGLEMGNLGADSIAYSLAPRLNSAGRLDRAVPSYDLLVTRDHDQACALSQELEKKNAERQRLTNDVWDKVKGKMQPVTADAPLVMAGEEDYPAGVVGIVASRLVDEFYRPAFIIKMGPDICRGSGRSIPEFDLVQALGQCSDLLVEYGGHSRAAGFAVSRENLDQLKERLQTIAGKCLANLELRPYITADAEVRLSSLNWDMYRSLERLAPFGSGNAVPTFVSRRMRLTDCRTMGSAGSHLRLKLSEGNRTWPAVGFGFGGMEKELTQYVDAVYNLEVDRWQGKETLRLNLLDMRPSL
jgi:single-stranded-DNA-specific exonuclease